MKAEAAISSGLRAVHVRTPLLWRNGIYVALALVVVLASITASGFATGSNLVNIMRASSVVGVIALGQTFVAIGGGLADLSVGATVSIAAVLALHAPTTSPLVALLVGCASGVAVGSFNGLVIGRFRANPVVATIGSGAVVAGLSLWYTNGNTSFSHSSSFVDLGTGSTLGAPNIVIAFALAAVLSHVVLRATIFGRRTYATGGSYEAARASGVPVRMITFAIFLIAGVAAALAGVMLAASLGQVNHDSGIGYTFNSIAAVAIGGTSLFGGEGGIPRTVAGVLLIGVLDNIVVLLGFSLYIQDIFAGLVILAAISADQMIRERYE